jgi:hypothetical protein
MLVDVLSVEGALPYGFVDPLYSYAQERGIGAMGDVARLAGANIGDDGLRELIVNTREPQTEQSAYIGPLVLSACAVMEQAGTRYVTANDLANTALTDLFEGYGADLRKLQDFGLFRLFAMADNRYMDGVAIDYQVQGEGRGAGAFWQLHISPRFGFVNLRACGPLTPLEGRANIAFVPGVAEALKADIATLGNRQ